MWPVVLIVVGLHGALLAVPVRSMGSNTGAVAGALQVRMLMAPAPVPAADAEGPPAGPRWSDARSDTQRAEPLAAPTDPADAGAQTATAETASASPPLPAISLAMAGIDSDGDYFPRAQLTLAPAPLASVVIDYPASENDPRRYHSELTLFIDETGRVVRVRVDGAALPPAFEEAARRAFTSARFHAGEADGRAVKSRIRVEVDFDNRPPGSAP
jgi:periplasmic protein TonB